MSQNNQSLYDHPFWRWVAPPAPPVGATHRQMELHRRAKTAALIGFVVIIFVLPALSSPTRNTILTVIGVVSLDLFAILYFNRKGQLIRAGILILLASHTGLLYTQFNYRNEFGGIDPGYLFQPALLIQSELVAASLLPAVWVFIIAGTNCLFWVIFALFSPHTTAFTALIEKLGMGYILAPPMVLYLIVSIILFIWVQSANQAIIRADKADSTAELSKQLAHKEYAYNMRLQRILAEIQANIAAIEADPRRPIVLGEGSTEDQRTIHGFLNNYRHRLVVSMDEERRSGAQLNTMVQAATNLISMLGTSRSAEEKLRFLQHWSVTGTIIDNLAVQMKLQLETLTLKRGESKQD